MASGSEVLQVLLRCVGLAYYVRPDIEPDSPVVIIAEDVSPTTTIETILESEVSDAEDDEVRDNAEPDSCPWDVSPTTSIETILVPVPFWGCRLVVGQIRR